MAIPDHSGGRRAAPQGVEYFDVAGYPLAFREEGEGPPLILIHGSVNDYRAWTQQLPAFAPTHRAIAVSLRHCYPEAWDGTGNDFTVETHAHDVAAFIEGRKLGPSDVVGHSRGGAVALVLALKHPRLVRKLVLADPGGLEALLPDSPDGRAMALQSAQMFERLRQDLAAGDVGSAARAFVETLGGVGAWDRRSPEQRQALLDNIATGPACAQRPRLAADDLAPLRMPILLMTGARSPPRYPLMLAAMKRVVPSVSAVCSVPDAAHSMNRENPDAFNAAVLRFLDDK